MKEYKFNDLFIGLEEKFTIQITKDMMNSFENITGDHNPLHTDIEYAKEKNFPNRVVYGMLTSSFISTLGGMYLPGKHCIIQSVESKFVSPVFPGDAITICGTVSELYESVKTAEIKILMYNQENKKVLKGKLKVGLLDE